MRQVSWPAAALTAVCAGMVSGILPAASQDYIVQQQQNGFSLPGVSLPQGQDEVRAADGTTCSSSIAGSGAYFDVGVIRGNNARSATEGLATYGRFVIPLGSKAKRLDCSHLYKLEVERMRMELDLLRMGVGRDITTGSTGSTDETERPQADAVPAKPAVRKVAAGKKKSKNWASEGWTTGDLRR